MTTIALQVKLKVKLCKWRLVWLSRQLHRQTHMPTARPGAEYRRTPLIVSRPIGVGLTPINPSRPNSFGYPGISFQAGPLGPSSNDGLYESLSPTCVKHILMAVL